MRGLDFSDRSLPTLFVEGGMDCLARADTNIGLLHHVGGGNLGDDATLDAVKSNIKARWPNVAMIALSINPDDTKKRHGILSHPIRRKGWNIGYIDETEEGTLKQTVKGLARKYRVAFYLVKATNSVVRAPREVVGELSFLMSSRRIVKSFKLLIICGGGQLTEKDGPWGFPYAIFKWIVLAKSAGVRCIVLNVGAGPLASPLGKFFVTRSLLATDYVSFRDNKSQALVQEIGFTGKSFVYPDSAYALEDTKANAGSLGGRVQSIVGFAPMPYPGPRNGYLSANDDTVYQEFMLKLAGFAASLASKSYLLSFFGTDTGVDPLAIEDLQAALLNNHGVGASQYYVNTPASSTQDLLKAISGMDYVVTCRFHGVVFAHLLNKPVLAIAPHPKVRDLMTDLGLSSYCVDVRDFDAKLLEERFASMVSNAREIKSRMALSLKKNRQLLKTQFDELFSN